MGKSDDLYLRLGEIINKVLENKSRVRSEESTKNAYSRWKGDLEDACK